MKHFAACLIALLLVACGGRERFEPVVVYASADDDAELAAWFEGFRQETGIPVTIRLGSSNANTQAIISKTGAPPADVIITSNVADIWRAADEGALRPLQAANLAAVPDTLKDADGMWAALSFDERVVTYRADAFGNPPKSYAGLGDRSMSERLCLGSSELPANRALVAMILNDAGRRPAESMVRAWVRNLSLPPFSSEQELVAAVEAGTCKYAVVSRSRVTAALAIAPFEKTYFDIEGVGVARHARYPESAHKLVNWMLQQRLPRLQQVRTDTRVGTAGWLDEDARMLVERAGYR